MPPLPIHVLQALHACESAAIVIGDDYRMLAANDAYLARYGAQVELGRSRCFEVSHGYDAPCDLSGELCPMRCSRETGRQKRVMHVHLGPDGPEHVDVHIEPLRDEAGEVRWFLERVQLVDHTSPRPGSSPMLGRSRGFLRFVELAHRVAHTDVPVLLLGESGTGKELAARMVHDLSARADGPFVPVECSGLPETLFESLLFGHERGAFTGADTARDGLVHAAAGGTLFLDEIGDVPPALQVKLLRLLESGSYRRVGAVEARASNFRLVCATHRDLRTMVSGGAFRSDLFFRINVFPVELPPLRDRRGDVSLIARQVLARVDPTKHLSADALSALERYDFPGNVRELRNVLTRAVLLTDDECVEPDHLPTHIRDMAVPAPDAPWGAVVPLADAESQYLRWAEERLGGDRRQLAAALGISERTLYRKLRNAPADGPVAP